MGNEIAQFREWDENDSRTGIFLNFRSTENSSFYDGIE